MADEQVEAPDPTPAIAARTLKAELEPDAVERFNPFAHMVEKLCGVLPIEKGKELLSLQKKPEVVRIALVSMPELAITKKDLKEFSSLGHGAEPPQDIDRGACMRRLVSYSEEISNGIFESFRNAMDAALTVSPHVICFNELGLPAVDAIPMPAAKRLAFETSRDKDVVIIAGSAHDSRTLYNTGFIFYPGGPDTGHSFHKTVSAVSVHELISAPAARRILLAKVAGLRIATMICLDIADYASLASVVKVADGIDVLLVPCYTNKFEKMDQIAEVASKALPGIVGMVNAVIRNVPAKPCQVAWFGSLRDPVDGPAAGSARISVIEIPVNDFREERAELRGSPESHMRWLFGRRDVPMLNKPY